MADTKNVSGLPETLSDNQNGHVPYPGIPTTTDGAGSVVWVETHITQAACAYPITSSTTMGGGYGAAVSNGRGANLWGGRAEVPRAGVGAQRSCRV